MVSRPHAGCTGLSPTCGRVLVTKESLKGTKETKKCGARMRRRYDLVYERGFLCSLPRERWADYASRMADLIAPGGRLVGLLLYGEEPEPPPFPLTDELAESVLGGFFKLVRTEAAAADTVPVYRGLERWQEWERKG